MRGLKPSRSLFLSLHRLGDLIMHAYVLKAFYDQKNASVSLLSHPFVKQVDFLLPFLDEIYIFERSQCQKSIGESFYNKEWAFKHISRILSDLNKKKFTKIFDITHSDTSARWMRFIDAKSKEGVSYNLSLTKKEFTAENSWIHYLHSSSRSKIHLIDLFKKAMNLELNSLPCCNENFLSFQRIVFQTNSSDIKKNWPVKSWISLLKKLKEQRPGYEFIVLCSPDEKRKVESEFYELGPEIKVIACTIFEAYQLLKESSLLVTLDTSIKHLATWSQTPIVELALGSSDPLETGAYQNGALILRPRVLCSPCRHSSPCSQKAFLCQNELTVESALHAINYRLNKIKKVNTAEKNPHQINKFSQQSQTNQKSEPNQRNQRNLLHQVNLGHQRNLQYHPLFPEGSNPFLLEDNSHTVGVELLEVTQDVEGWWRGFPVYSELKQENARRDDEQILFI